MINKLKKTIFIVFLILIVLSAFSFIRTQSIVTASPPVEDRVAIYKQENRALKERSLQLSPDGLKVAYFQQKFINSIKEISDPDYALLIVEQQDGQPEVVFKNNFRLSYFEWLNNDEIKVYKGCGSGCLLSYVVNTHTKQYKESIEKIFSFD